MKKSLINKTVSLLLVSVVALLCACGTEPEVTNTAETTKELPSPSGGSAYNGLFDSIIDINITMGDAELATINDHADAELYCECDVTAADQTVKSAGIKPRGNISYINEAGMKVYSFKLKFNKYTKGQKLNGLDELYLNNMSYDPSCCREYLAYYLFSLENGVKAPLAQFARLTVNGEYYGLYLAVESADDSFLKRCFGDNDGNLFKAGKGSAFISDDVSTFSLENGSDKAMKKLSALYEALMTGEDIKTVLDVESVLRYAAITSLICAQDSYLGAKAEGYFLYEKSDGALSIVPWDLKVSFGIDKTQRKTDYVIDEALVSAPVTEPFSDASADDRPLVYRLLENSEYKKQYLGYVKYYNEQLSGLPDLLAELKGTLDTEISKDPNRFYDDDIYQSEFADGSNTLYGFIKARSENVSAQLLSMGE